MAVLLCAKRGLGDILFALLRSFCPISCTKWAQSLCEMSAASLLVDMLTKGDKKNTDITVLCG